MGKSRLEAFSDGVIAIIITIMVLDLKVPAGTDFTALVPVLPVFLNYVLSFATVAIYWNNHHHLLHASQRISGAVLWANTHLLFWLSLFPFVTGWMGENYSAHLPAAIYGGVAFMASISYWLLERVIIAVDGAQSTGPESGGTMFTYPPVEAIGEFKLLTQDPEREVFALTMIGECCEAKGSLTDAIIRYKEGLNCPQITPEETIQLYYCLGSTFERLADQSEALYFYEKVAKRDPKFREVDGKIAALKPRSARQA